MDDNPEHLNKFSHYRKLISVISKHSNYPLIYSLLGALTGSIIYTNKPLYGFVLYSWTFLILYFIIVNIYVIQTKFLS